MQWFSKLFCSCALRFGKIIKDHKKGKEDFRQGRKGKE